MEHRSTSTDPERGASAPRNPRRVPVRADLPEVVVRVLGPADVIGAERPFARAWTFELVVYLAMHPEGTSCDAWATALWPDRLLADVTRYSTVSAARRSLGRSASGADHLPRAENGRLKLSPSVTTDWAQFLALSDAGGPAAPEAWSSALDLVRGRPFEGLRAPDWAVLEGVEAQVQDAVVQLGIKLAEWLLRDGDGRGAELAARKALRVAPYDERLYRLLLVAADRQGNPAAVDSTMAELLRLLAGGEFRVAPTTRSTSGHWCDRDDPLTLVHPETAALYRSLSRRPGLLRRVLGRP